MSTENLGDVLRELIAKHQYTGADVAAAIGLSSNALSAILTNKSKPRFNTLAKLRGMLAKSPDDRERLMRAYEGEEYKDPDRETVVTQIEEERAAPVEQKRAEDYLDAKAHSIAFRNDISSEMDKAKIAYIRDFTFEYMSKKAVADFVTRSSKNRIAIEVKYNLQRDWDHTLGTCIMLRRSLPAKAVLVVIPYYNQTAIEAKKYFEQEDIHVVRIDELASVLKKLGA